MATPRPPRPTTWRSKSPASAIAVAAATAATLLLLFLLLKTGDRASAAITSSSPSSRTSSAAASVSLHAKWQAAPLVLEAVEFLVRERDRNYEKLKSVDARENVSMLRSIIGWRKDATKLSTQTSLSTSHSSPHTRLRSPPRPSGASQSASGRPLPSAAAAVKKEEKMRPLLPRLRAGRRSSAPRPAPCRLLPLLPPLLRPCSAPLPSRSRRGSTPRALSSRGRSWRRTAFLLLPLRLLAASPASAGEEEEEPRGATS